MSPRALTRGLRRLFRRDRAEQDLNDEVEHYIEQAASAYMRDGMSRHEATRRARLEFGGIESAKEEVRNAHWDGWLDVLRRDVAYAVRGLRRSPGFTIVAVVTLALGIGATTSMFSVLNTIVLRPLPYRDADHLAFIYANDVKRGLQREGLTWLNIQDFRRGTHSFDDLGYFTTGRSSLIDGSNRERTRVGLVSGNTFAILGRAPIHGRTLVPADETNEVPAAVISHALWVRRYGGDSSVIGRTMNVEQGGRGVFQLQIIGVMPADFYFPDKLVELWMPATQYWRFRRESIERFSPWAARWTAFGRLRAGSTFESAASDLAQIGKRLSVAYPTTDPDFAGFATSVIPVLDSVAGRNLQVTLWLLLGAVALVLLVACVNVANLLLARGASRQREFAIRRALGAERSRLIRQLATESMVLAVAGGTLGVLAAIAWTKTLAAIGASQLPRMDELAIDRRVLLFSAAASIVAGLVFGMVPAFRVSSSVPSNNVTRATRGLLVAAECAIAIVLLAGAGLLLRSLSRVNSIDPGFNPRGVVTARIEHAPQSADEARVGPGFDALRATGRVARLANLTARLTAMPGVESVGYVDDLFTNAQGNDAITIPGRSTAVPAGELNQGNVSPGFFRTLGVRIVRGRDLTSDDVATKIRAIWQPIYNDRSLAEKERLSIPEPVVVNESFVRRFFPGEDPIGKRFCTDPTNKTYWYTIVGVAKDMHRSGLERAVIPEYFGSYLPAPNARGDIVIRTTGASLQLPSTLRQMIAEDLPGTTVVSISTADRQLGDFAAQRSLQTWLLTLFAVLAATLAAIGIYGVVHYAVAERTREMGVRVALGASPAAIMALVIRQGMTMPVIGMGAGVAGALLATRLLSHLLFGVGATDPITFVVVLVSLAGVALVACLVPARRATRVDPLTALRAE
jgi:predicted permease